MSDWIMVCEFVWGCSGDEAYLIFLFLGFKSMYSFAKEHSFMWVCANSLYKKRGHIYLTWVNQFFFFNSSLMENTMPGMDVFQFLVQYNQTKS